MHTLLAALCPLDSPLSALVRGQQLRRGNLISHLGEKRANKINYLPSGRAPSALGAGGSESLRSSVCLHVRCHRTKERNKTKCSSNKSIRWVPRAPIRPQLNRAHIQWHSLDWRQQNFYLGARISAKRSTTAKRLHCRSALFNVARLFGARAKVGSPAQVAIGRIGAPPKYARQASGVICLLLGVTGARQKR